MKSRLATYIRCSFPCVNLGRRILASTLLAVIVTAAAGAQSAPAVSSAEARKAIEAGYAEWAKAGVAHGHEHDREHAGSGFLLPNFPTEK